MDMKVIVLRKVAALERIEAGLGLGEVRRVGIEPALAEMLRLERIAEALALPPAPPLTVLSGEGGKQ
jgi:hypothetical protein